MKSFTPARRASLSSLAVAGVLLLATGARAADTPILGTWTVENGEKVEIAPCGKAFCATVTTGVYKGRAIGRMAGSGTSYTGTVTDPTNNKTYEGSAEVSRKALVLQGCVAKIFCRSQTWTR